MTVRRDKWIRDNGREPKDDDIIFEIRSFAVSSTWKDINAVDPKDLKENWITLLKNQKHY